MDESGDNALRGVRPRIAWLMGEQAIQSGVLKRSEYSNTALLPSRPLKLGIGPGILKLASLHIERRVGSASGCGAAGLNLEVFLFLSICAIILAADVD
jgi:hypothetical protein